MALIKCAKCGKTISDTASVCPSCGEETASVRTASRRRRSSRKLALLALIIAVELLIFWRSGANNRDKGAPSTNALAAPLTLPQSVAHQRKQLKEGQSATYPFFLGQGATVRIEITATPKPVDVMVMTSEEAAKFQQGEGKFFAFLAPAYTSRQELAAQDVMTMDRTDTLPQGNWVIVITRPREAVFFKKDTVVSTVLTIY